VALVLGRAARSPTDDRLGAAAYVAGIRIVLPTVVDGRPILRVKRRRGSENRRSRRESSRSRVGRLAAAITRNDRTRAQRAASTEPALGFSTAASSSGGDKVDRSPGIAKIDSKAKLRGPPLLRLDPLA
jgi:hypothetical protein